MTYISTALHSAGKRRCFLRRAAATMLALFASIHLQAQDVIALDGLWDFCTGDSAVFDDTILLPGSMLTYGKGDPVSTETQWTGSLYDSSFYFNPYMEKYRKEGNVKFPFFLTPERHYVGPAWYRRSVYIPNSWKSRRMKLFLERPHIETTVWINGKAVGRDSSLSVPHRFDVTNLIKPGQRNEILIRVDNRIEGVGVGQDSHSVTDQTQGNWNGIAGRIEILSQPKRFNVKKVTVREIDGLNMVKVGVELENHTPLIEFMPLMENGVCLEVRPHSEPKSRPKVVWAIMKSRNYAEAFVRLGSNALRWDEFNPRYYDLHIYAGDDYYETTFGLRTIKAEGRQLTINGRPLFLRGTVESCLFPETGYPPTSVEEWTRVFRKCKEYGLNHVRFHSYCPPDAAFTAADNVGIYLQAEGPTWPNHGVRLRRGQTIDKYLLDESKRIVDEYGHHPSFIMMAAGNEPAGDWVAYCRDWVGQMHAYDPSRLYCGASVGGGWAWDDGSEYHVKGGARGLDWDRRQPQSADDYYDQIERPRNYRDSLPNQSPIIAHEQGQWCAFPDFSEIPLYTGPLKAGNLEIFRDLLREGGMEEMGRKFLMASGRLQTLCYKYEIERNLRTADYSGFQLLGLNDYSGQGTALVGPLNVFWREKAYTVARQWRQWCYPVVLLARFPRFVYENTDTLNVPIEVYNAYIGTLKDMKTRVFVWADSTLIAQTTIQSTNIPIGKNTRLGNLVMPLDSLKVPTKCIMLAQMGGKVQNTWEFWVYPAEKDQPADSVAAKPATPLGSEHSFTTIDLSSLSHEEAMRDVSRAENLLQAGTDVLLLCADKVTLGSDVTQHYLPVFWNTSWFKMRPPHTTGAYIDKSHPLFAHGFPTDDWGNLNWWELLNRAPVMNLRELPASYQPPVQPIDTWHVSRKLGMIVEAKVGRGRIFMTTLDLTSQPEKRIVARQLRHAVTEYMQSADFKPTLELQPETLRHFFTETAPPVRMYTNDSPDELKPKLTQQ